MLKFDTEFTIPITNPLNHAYVWERPIFYTIPIPRLEYWEMSREQQQIEYTCAVGGYSSPKYDITMQPISESVCTFIVNRTEIYNKSNYETEYRYELLLCPNKYTQAKTHKLVWKQIYICQIGMVTSPDYIVAGEIADFIT